MKLLVLVADYPTLNGSVALMYVHVRNKSYAQNNINVTVLNFKAKENYVIDNINVITYFEYKKQQQEFDILICHASNIRNHYKFLKKYEQNFIKIVFVFHGHEVVRIGKVYPKPYKYKRKLSIVKKIGQDIYDTIKLKIWNNYFQQVAYKSHFVFVSNLMYKDFLYWTKIKPSTIEGKYSIIYNSVAKIFEERMYPLQNEKLYDYITIRSNLDSSVYCIDIVVGLARKYGDKKFLVIGEGEYFEYNEKPENIILKKQHIQHEDMLSYINESICALMPTRRDSQGVMSCELATYGIPLITSNIQVCHEVFSKFDNVAYIDNKNLDFDLNYITTELIKKVQVKKQSFYYQSNTCSREIELFNGLMSQSNENIV